MKTISLRIGDDLYLWLEKRSAELGRSKSDIAREALIGLRMRKKKTRTVHEIMEDTCGAIKGAPKDYAINKKHMEAFGE